MQRKVTSYRLPDITLRQIKELVQITGSSDANVISTALDRMYQQETKTMSRNLVNNRNNKQIDFDAAVNLMDDDIREQLHNRQSWQSNQQFFTAYELAHELHFGEEWELSKSNPVW